MLAARRERPDVTLPESLSTLSDEEKKDLVIKIVSVKKERLYVANNATEAVITNV